MKITVHGVIAPERLQRPQPVALWRVRAGRIFHLYRYLIIFVLVPTLLVAGYYFLIASDQYETSADFVVRKADSSGAQLGGGQLLGFNLGGSVVPSETYIVNDYLLSHDAVSILRRQDRLVERYTRSSIDPFNRLWQSNPTPEQLLKYYRNHVFFVVDTETGITHMSVRAFSPDDAYKIGVTLLSMGEEQINQLNIRSYRDQVSHARSEAELANSALQQVEQELTDYRRSHGHIDPEGSGKAQVTLVTNLTEGLTTARARLKAMAGVVSASSPQYRAMLSQVRALEAQVAAQSQKLAGGDGSIATSLGGYESLQIRREATVRRYAAAAAIYQNARSEAQRKQTYLIRVADANRAVKSLYPERWKIVGTVFLSLLFAYAIGWLLVQGVKEHQV